MRRWSALLGLFVVVLCATRTSRAEPAAGVHLTWDAPATCPSRVAADKAIQALVGPLSSPFRAEIWLRQEGTVWVGVLATPGARRELQAATCKEVAQALIVILALAINPNASVGEGSLGALETPEAATASPPTRAPAGPSVAEDAEPPRTRRERPEPAVTAQAVAALRTTRARWGAALRLFGNVGVLPEPTIGPSLGVRYGSRSWFGALNVLAALPRSGEVASQPGHGGTLDWAAARLEGAGAFPGLPGFWLFGGVDIGRLAGRGYGVDHKVTGQALWLGLLAGARVRPLSTRDFALEIGAAAGVPLLRPTFGLKGIGPVHRPSVLEGWADLGIVWR